MLDVLTPRYDSRGLDDVPQVGDYVAELTTDQPERPVPHAGMSRREYRQLLAEYEARSARLASQVNSSVSEQSAASPSFASKLMSDSCPVPLIAPAAAPLPPQASDVEPHDFASEDYFDDQQIAVTVVGETEYTEDIDLVNNYELDDATQAYDAETFFDDDTVVYDGEDGVYSADTYFYGADEEYAYDEQFAANNFYGEESYDYPDAFETGMAFTDDPEDFDAALPTRRQHRRAEERAQRDARWARSAVFSGNLPKVGMVGALGVATVVAPSVINHFDAGHVEDGTAMAAKSDQMANALTGPITISTSTQAAAIRHDLGSNTSEPSVITVSNGTTESAEALESRRAEAEQASRDFNRPLLPGCDGKPTNFNAPNGQLDRDDLCLLWNNRESLRSDAALAFAKLNVEYKAKFGEDIWVTDGYRTYAQQVVLKRRKPRLAARPGTSQHGWAMAVDLAGGIQNGGAEYRWMRENAPRFGWDNPPWARSGGNGPYEPWHWEFTPGSGSEA